jgi:hypothetical protein
MVLSGMVTQSSSHGACIELTADCALALGSWVVLSDAHRLRSGCDARIVGIEGRTCRIAFDPGFVTAMEHFGHLDARRAAHRNKQTAGVAEELAVSPTRAPTA